MKWIPCATQSEAARVRDRFDRLAPGAFPRLRGKTAHYTAILAIDGAFGVLVDPYMAGYLASSKQRERSRLSSTELAELESDLGRQALVKRLAL